MHTRAWLRRFAASVIGGLLVATLSGLPAASAAETAEGVRMQDEAWYLRFRDPIGEQAPDGGLPDPGGTGLPAVGESTVREHTNPYPPETLHVGVNLGEPEARTFVGFPLFELGGGLPAIVTGGTVTFTAYEDPAAGTRNADGADMVACAATDLVVHADGGDWETQPTYDETLCSPLTRVPDATPATWTTDLAPFAALWSNPDANFGLAVVANPASEAPAPQQTWHVAFVMKSFLPTEGETAPPPITAALQFERQELPTFGGVESGGTAGSGGAAPLAAGPGPALGSSAGGFGSTESGFAVGGDDLSADSSGVFGPEVAVAEQPAVGGELQQDAPAQSVAAASQAPQGVVAAPGGGLETAPRWLFALVGLSLAGLVGWSLNKPVVLPEQREGAVSRLIRRRGTRAARARVAD